MHQWRSHPARVEKQTAIWAACHEDEPPGSREPTRLVPVELRLESQAAQVPRQIPPASSGALQD